MAASCSAMAARYARARAALTIGALDPDTMTSTAQQPSPPPAAPRHPANLRELFWAFTFLALQGFGGVLAVVQRELVDRRRWITNEEFIEDWAVAQILPGPNVVNLSMMIGDRYFGLRGAVTAVVGMLCIPMLLVILLAIAYAHYADIPQVSGALRGMGAVAAGLVIGAGFRLAVAFRKHTLGRVTCWSFAAITFAAMAMWRLPLSWVLFTVGGAACVLAWFKLGHDAIGALRGTQQ